MLSAQSQLLERNLTLFDDGQWLIINPTDAYFCDLIADKETDILHQYFDIFSESAKVIQSHELDSRDVASKTTGFSIEQKVSKHLHTFSPFVDTTKSYSHVLIYLPKSKAHLAMLLQMASAVLPADGQIYLVGENKGGIKSAGKLAEKYGTVSKIDSARHCSLINIHVEQRGEFNIDQWLDAQTYELDGCEWEVTSMPGVFSYKELDTGTRLLLEKLPSNLRGDILDFACGAGVIGANLLKQYPHLSLTMLDVNALALFCAARTLHANDQVATLIAANGLHGVNDKFQHIVTNPPFHTGVKTDYSITRRFITDAKRVLTTRGSMYMVANRFLPYPGLLSDTFGQVRTLAQTSQFSVYLALV